MKADGVYITPKEPSDFEDWVDFALALFTEAKRPEMAAELRRIDQLSKYQTFFARTPERAVGYATLTIRTDHVEGATTTPVGYLEAIYVDPDFRNNGIAKALYSVGESWCKEKGCTEMGSDTWHWNTAAQDFHKRLGFREEDILVHFYKKIDP